MSVLRKKGSDQAYYYCRAHYCPWLRDPCTYNRFVPEPITDGDGHLTELGELIDDDKAIDLEAWLDNATWRLGCPQRLVDIARKIAYGIPLTKTEARYLERYRQKELVLR